MPARRILKGKVTPLRVPRSAAGVLFFGGSFDPPHKAHLALSKSLRKRRLGPRWWLVFVPAAQSPLKGHGPEASARHRIAMLRLAAARTKDAFVWTDEIDRARRNGPSYWIETLRRARRVLPPGTPIRFIIGSDQAVAFHRWKSYREILKLAHPLVLVRSPYSRNASVLRAMKRTGAWSAEELRLWREWLDDVNCFPMSSTTARNVVSRNGQTGAWLGPSIRTYIARHRLYRKLS